MDLKGDVPRNESSSGGVKGFWKSTFTYKNLLPLREIR
jgi:hypothetical protein